MRGCAGHWGASAHQRKDLLLKPQGTFWRRVDLLAVLLPVPSECPRPARTSPPELPPVGALGPHVESLKQEPPGALAGEARGRDTGPLCVLSVRWKACWRGRDSEPSRLAPSGCHSDGEMHPTYPHLSGRRKQRLCANYKKSASLGGPGTSRRTFFGLTAPSRGPARRAGSRPPGSQAARSNGLGEGEPAAGAPRSEPGANPEDCALGVRSQRLCLTCDRKGVWLQPSPGELAFPSGQTVYPGHCFAAPSSCLS